MKRGVHVNKHLQASFNKYGEKNFKFELLEECLSEYCISTEQYWINILNVCDKRYGYNTNPVANSRKGVLHSEETKRKISKNRTGIPTTKGLRPSIKIKKKISNTVILLHKLGLYKESNKLKQKIVLKLDEEDNILKEYDSCTSAAKDMKVTKASISYACKGKTRYIRGFKWKYKNEDSNN